MISINEPIEDTPTGRILEGIIEVIDEFYSANLSQDVLRGQGENASRGFFNGGRAPYGYIRTQVRDGVHTRTKLEPDPKTSPIVRRIFRECLEGKGLKAIARGLNIDQIPSFTAGKWGATSIEKILHNEAYTGTLIWGRRKKDAGLTITKSVPLRVEGAWPAIIDKSVFNQGQAMLEARSPIVRHPREVDSPYLLSGIIRCQACGAAIVGHGGSKGYRYYFCGNARRKGREVCSLPLLPKNSIESFIIDRMRNYILTEDNLVEMVELTNQELAQGSNEFKERLDLIDGQISEISSRLGRLYDALETGEFESRELAPRIRELMRKQEEFRQLRIEVEQTLHYESKCSVDYNMILGYAEKLRSLLARSSITEQRSVLRSFCNKIEVNNTGVKMYYTVPMPPDGDREELVGFVPIVHHG